MLKFQSVWMFKFWTSNSRGNFLKVLRSWSPWESEGHRSVGFRGPGGPRCPGVPGLGPTFLPCQLICIDQLRFCIPCLRKISKMLNITSKYFWILKYMQSISWVTHVTRDLITCYSLLYYSFITFTNLIKTKAATKRCFEN